MRCERFNKMYDYEEQDGMFSFKKAWMIDNDHSFFSKWKPYYENKFKIISELDGIEKIAEIGVRAGYSAKSFLKAHPSAKYVGFDYYGHDGWGFGITNEILIKSAKSLLSSYDFEIRKVNTQEINKLDLKDVDFFHVDADHSYEGALHDLNLALETLSSNGYILLDDVGWGDKIHPGERIVRRAADEFIKVNNLNYKHIESLTGEYLIWKK
jgi:predicted O-methyltransferase YrrM